MKIAIAKPDYGAVGGFELVVQRLADGLRARGHVVELVSVETSGDPTTDLPLHADETQLRLFREFFFHLNMVARFEQLDLSAYDVVLCTQPGSYAVRHPRKVVLFYHHTRSFYDLQDVIEGTRGHDVDLHQLASVIIRDVDAVFLTKDVPILAGSRRVKQRLADHNQLHHNVEVFSAGIDEAFSGFGGPVTFESPLCVGRHEFPKRTELFLHAMQHVDGLRGRLLGAGSFTERLQGIDAWLRVQHFSEPSAAVGKTLKGLAAKCFVDDQKLWRQYTIHLPVEELEAAHRTVKEKDISARVDFLGRGSAEDLLREYASALCVVCPAYDEDYGLTCVEAMACGKPVIACRDGGGYVELIDDGIDGFLVDPSARAIARAIERLKDRELARAMGDRGREKARTFTWPRAIDQVEHALTVAQSRRQPA